MHSLTLLVAVYKAEKTQLVQFLESTRSILQTLAGHAQEIEKLVHIDPQNSVEIISRGTRHIALLYHQVSRRAQHAISCQFVTDHVLAVRDNCNTTTFTICSYGTVGI